MPLILSLLIFSVISTAAKAQWPPAKESRHRHSLINVLKSQETKMLNTFENVEKIKTAVATETFRLRQRLKNPSSADLWVSVRSISMTLQALRLC